ncbi:hypothetical protein CLAFUW4_07493 [Fulvia fulva]|uniref:Uncharacterized protein n=1 Tax=Passalora fulva TaxID=5499 RepID=A0A9Q8UR26_PASFU|nr:uncharacterized protein CLAFUR5_07623 [Fulvia fulva]KAK4621466.1 hypothetical protein CLAFUR4_07499 [Fulvia fulva]KAK4622573.1 hypothetical protein CLAFUR0_07499 [Fulvia fulva]UJO19374.1 hypothetical protein CLAFUR5_07623 [Fulvia fulva]WPV16564.1 hypothetical protein CLAFUW4_07493 [Fulvia fulva]WPV30762.1 hypothetical protein CLAFUW7_07495 [Fulvia fulva]
MGDLRGATRHQQQANSFYAPSQRSIINPDLTSTAYHGAAGNIDSHWNAPPAIRLDKDGFQDIQLCEESRLIRECAATTSPPTREGLGNRLLSTIQQQSASPTATALARSGTALHNRARSWAAYVPKLNTNSNQSSPTKGQPRPANEKLPNKLFGDLFHGESAPVHLGVPTSPTKELDESELVMDYQPGFTERPSARHARRGSTMSVKSTKGPAKTSWFGRKASTPAPKVNAIEDEILSININTSLFPHGQGDTLSPQSYNDLLLNATNLLQRMQASYKEKVEYIASIQPEIDAQKEEVEEAEIRSAHLKRQLEDLGKQQEEQKQVNEELMTMLSETKMKLSEEREKSKTIRLVPRDTEGGASDDESRRRGKRRSAGNASDSGFESDADTASVFSSGMQTPASHRQPHFMLSDHDATPRRRALSPRESVASSNAWSGSTKHSTVGNTVAWTTLEQLRHENRQLRMEKEVIQQNLQGCIEIVDGLAGGLAGNFSKLEPYSDD